MVNLEGRQTGFLVQVENPDGETNEVVVLPDGPDALVQELAGGLALSKEVQQVHMRRICLVPIEPGGELTDASASAQERAAALEAE